LKKKKITVLVGLYEESEKPENPLELVLIIKIYCYFFYSNVLNSIYIYLQKLYI